MSPLMENPKSILENIINLLLQGVKDRHHAFHTLVFTNTNLENNPNSRVVVLRNFDPEKYVINFHTDFRSPKVSELLKNNNTIFVFYDHKLKIQLRIRTKSIINNQNTISKLMWDKTKLFSRKCYLTNKSPSSITKEPEDGIDISLRGKEPTIEISEKGYKNFTVIKNIIQEIDWLYLASSGHRRLKINLNKNKPIFDWLIP